MEQTNNSQIITVKNDIAVSVPNSLQLMTPYVLCEQNDWFEDEIKFLRSFIKPNMKVIDIGANYGLYTLTIAKIIAEKGKIWAFEPCSSTFSHLTESVLLNNFNNIELIQAGLSDEIRRAKFFTTPNSELNSLSNEALSSNNYETIDLLTLDHCAQKFDWKEIDFIKLDAEGEESNILKKGIEFLSTNSPLIMYELKHGAQVNVPLIDRFKELGYNSYRLIPGLNVLTPFDHNDKFDGYLLNLFCCKKDKAHILEGENIIINTLQDRSYDEKDKALLQKCIAKFSFKEILDKIISEKNQYDNNYVNILKTYLLTLSDSISPFDKLCCLMTSLKQAGIMINNGEKRFGPLCAFARIAFDAGERSLGIKILSHLINKYSQNLNFEINEPLLPASSRYDAIHPDDNKIKEWLYSSVLEQYVVKHAFSTYFTRLSSLPVLEKMSSLGFMDDEMKRRKELIQNCFSS